MRHGMSQKQYMVHSVLWWKQPAGAAWPTLHSHWHGHWRCCPCHRLHTSPPDGSLSFRQCTQASGRAAVAVAWGPWGGAGMAAADASLAARLTRQGDVQAAVTNALGQTLLLPSFRQSLHLQVRQQCLLGAGTPG